MSKSKKQVIAPGLVVQNKLLRIVNYVLLSLFLLIVIVPILIVFVTSFKTNKEYMYTKIWDMPKSFLNFDNYRVYFDRGKYLVGLKNVSILILVALVSSVVMGTMVSFIMTRFDFRLKKIILGLYIFAAIIPGTTTAVATFKIIQHLHLYNTMGAGCLLYSATGVLDIYLFMQFIRGIPLELDESAMLDGATYFRIYRSIVLPLMVPAISTVSILKVVWIYNDFFIPITYMPNMDLMTVSTGLKFFSTDRITQWNVMAAGIIAVMLPTLLVYLLMQKYIIAGALEGSVKS